MCLCLICIEARLVALIYLHYNHLKNFWHTTKSNILKLGIFHDFISRFIDP